MHVWCCLSPIALNLKDLNKEQSTHGTWLTSTSERARQSPMRKQQSNPVLNAAATVHEEPTATVSQENETEKSEGVKLVNVTCHGKHLRLGHSCGKARLCEHSEGISQ
eukprot:414973-Amphidinium_carterae.1